MQLRRMLGIQPGLTAIIGGGGKTTLLYALAFLFVQLLLLFSAILIITCDNL